MEKVWLIAAIEKALCPHGIYLPPHDLYPQCNMIYSPNLKYSVKDTMSVKVSSMHYMNWTRVMLPGVFEQFELVFIFSLFFLFTIIVNS